jgi:hypothetical protein
MSAEDDPFAPKRSMQLAASNRKPAKRSRKIKRATLTAVPSPPIRSTIDDDPFAEADPFAGDVVPASPAVAGVLHAPTHSLDDPFSDELSLPFIAVGRSKIWNGKDCVPHLVIFQIGLEPTETVGQFSIAADQEALKAAADVAGRRGLVLLDGVQRSDVIAALEEGIRAVVRCRRSQAVS